MISLKKLVTCITSYHKPQTTKVYSGVWDMRKSFSVHTTKCVAIRRNSACPRNSRLARTFRIDLVHNWFVRENRHADSKHCRTLIMKRWIAVILQQAVENEAGGLRHTMLGCLEHISIRSAGDPRKKIVHSKMLVNHVHYKSCSFVKRVHLRDRKSVV